MARRSTFDVEAGRRFLAGLPEFQPTKPLSEYRPATIRRYTEQFQQQLSRGVPLSRQAARGHVVTPEHGPKGARPKLPAAAREYRGGKLPKSKYLPPRDGGIIGGPRRKQKREHPGRPINVPERLDLSDGSVTFTFVTTDPAPLMQKLQDHWDDRVIITGFDCDHQVYRSLGINRGHSRGWTAQAIWEAWQETTGGGSRAIPEFEDWFIDVANGTDSDPDQAAIRIAHVCLWQIYVYPDHVHAHRPGGGLLTARRR